MASSENPESEKDISEICSAGEDMEFSDDDELRQMKEELEKIRAEKKQNKLARKKEMLKQLIEAEKSNLHYIKKGKSAKQNDIFPAETVDQQQLSENDEATLYEGIAINKDKCKTKKDTGRCRLTTDSSKTRNVVSLKPAQVKMKDQIPRKDSVEKKLNLPIDYAYFELFISKIGLGMFYPEKMLLSDVMKMKANEVSNDLEGIASMFIRNLIMINFTCRDKMLEEYIHDIPSEGGETPTSANYLDKLLEDENDNNKNIVNPLDLILAVFKCSSPMLKQIIAAKLFMCQLAIPLVFPAVVNDTILVSIWPLRSIIIDRKTDKGSFQNIAVDCKCQTVSFIRIGRPSVSKSKLINEILTDQYHSTFFNKDCPLGTTTRSLSEGMLEVAWYLPSSKSSVLSKVCLFLNLRGDGTALAEQVKLVSTLSSVVVIIMEATSLGDTSNQQLIREFHHANAGVILAIDARKDTKTTIKQNLQTYSNNIRKFEETTRFIILSVDGQDRSIAQIKNEMRNGIKDLIQGKQDVSLSERLSTYSGKIDEENECLSSTRKLAEGIINLIPPKSLSTSIKDRIIPLQGKYWREWSQKNKATNKAPKSTNLIEFEKIKDEMKKIRLKQAAICEHLGSFMRLFLKSLLKLLPSKNEYAVFVVWLKYFLDERSRNILPTYLSKYQSDWQALKSARDKKDTSSMTRLRSELDESEYNLAEASFGFEHLCREMGQIYEALCTCEAPDQQMKELRQQLPVVTANLLLLGQPFEIMDGDVANVPIVWVKAVLNNLKAIIGNKTLLALSVLGIQSSGKSTLLNTMFGLQFAVSAGRCTRGVFMQLVPADDEYFPFDWVLVIDTEGLRAPELGHQKYSHDNELATFVIGLGDITIVNIKGENTAEVKDVLQIAVHAFLRLKLANKNLNLKQSCVFVHQNVPAIDANDKMVHGRQKFVEILDAMTKEAADQEDIAEIHSFNQVIEFDSEKNVWYFSDLWRGDPPMCPANPGYSENTINVRNAIMFELTSKRKTYLTVEDTISRIDDLWNGILKDDFVFSFRNSLELKAYNSMERHCASLTWDLEKFVMEFMRSDAESSLVNCENPNDLDKVIPSIIKRLAVQIEAKVTSVLSELDAFIEGNTLKEVMIQWKQNKQNRFKMQAKDLILESKSEINKTKEEIRFKKIRVSEQTTHEIEINKMARQLALKMRGKSPDENVMKQIFDDMFNTWIEKFATTDIRDVVSINDQIETLFCEKFSADAAFIFETKTFEPRYYAKLSKLEDTIPYDWIVDKHISIHKVLFWKRENIDNCVSQTYDRTNKILRKIDTKLSELNVQDKRFNISYVTEIFHYVINGIDEHNSQKAKEYHFNLLPPFRAMMLAHVLRYAMVFFTRLNDAYNRKHSPKAQMQAYKGTAWTLFKNLVQSKTEDVIALGFFREALMKTVEEHVLVLLPIDVQDKILKLFSNGKFSLIKDILVHLAQKEKFDDIKSFIEDPRGFAETWIIELTNNQLFDEISSGINTFTRLSQSRISYFFSKLSKSIKKATQSTQTSISIWIEQFVQHSNDTNGIPLSNATFVHVKDRKVPDLQNFVEMLEKQLCEMENEVLNSFKSKTASHLIWKTNPIISIMDKLWGCTEVCMFCGEPCMNTDKNHIEYGHLHKCLQHRPEGIGGMRRTSNQKMVEDFCNHSVNSDASYKNVRGKNGKYSEYKKNFPDWEIAPNSDVSKYWIWIFFNFQKELKLMHNAELPICPANWSSISKLEAIESLC